MEFGAWNVCITYIECQCRHTNHQILDSIVVSIPACHAGDRGSIPRRGDILICKYCKFLPKIVLFVLK